MNYQKPEQKALVIGVDSKFHPPMIEDCRFHAAKIGLIEREADKFWYYFDSNGWKVGKNPMKSWKSAMVGWKLRWEDAGRPGMVNKPDYFDKELRQASAQTRKLCQ